jgi:hypothetical protein
VAVTSRKVNDLDTIDLLTQTMLHFGIGEQKTILSSEQKKVLAILLKVLGIGKMIAMALDDRVLTRA